MSFATYYSFGVDLCRALGVDPDVTRRIEITVDVNEPVIVTLEQLVPRPDCLQTWERRYVLVPRAGWGAPWGPPLRPPAVVEDETT